MVTIPKRITLVSQAADALRQGIRSGEWLGRLPAEGELAETFNVSRVTVRAAVKILGEEGSIEVHNGQRAKIVGHPAVPLSEHRPTVGLVFSVYESMAFYAAYHRRYCEILQDLGVGTKTFSGRQYYRQGSLHALEELILSSQVDLWVVAGSSRAMQDWFGRQRIPVVLDGTCLSDGSLPALDIDNRGILRHAVGLLLGLGHRRIAYLTIRSTQGGDVASLEGFEDGFKNLPEEEARGTIVYCDDSPEDIRRALDRLFGGGARPTALIAGRLGITLHSVAYLLSRGFRIPRDVSIISRDDMPLLDYMEPSVARYALEPEKYARRLAQMTLKFLSHSLPPTQQHAVPNFIRGNSIGPCQP